MKIRKILPAVLGVCMAFTFFAVPAKALDMGVYLGTNTTSYYNPDTGEIDDGGTQNAALGEGMCRSATGNNCLLEVDRDGNMWLTVRLLLQSNCKDIKLYTRTGNNTYSQVSYDIVSEDSGQDSVDYRFRVYSSYVQLKGTMYVTPMGRDVLWYMTCSGFNPGSGDFVVSIDTTPPAPEPEPEPVKAEEPKKEEPKKEEPKKEETAKPAETESKKTEEAVPAANTITEEKKEEAPAANGKNETANPNEAEKKEEAAEEPAVDRETAEETEEILSEEEEKLEENSEESAEKADEQADLEEEAAVEAVPAEEPEKSGGIGKGGIAAIIIVAAAAVVFGVTRARKGKK